MKIYLTILLSLLFIGCGDKKTDDNITLKQPQEVRQEVTKEVNNTKLAEELVIKAIDLSKNKKQIEAIPLFQKAIKLDSKNYTAYLGLGLALHYRGSQNKSVEDLHDAYAAMKTSYELKPQEISKKAMDFFKAKWEAHLIKKKPACKTCPINQFLGEE